MSGNPGGKPGIRVYKIVVLGDGGVGKSEDAYQQQCRVDDEAAQLDILDTAGQPEFTAMREQYMRTGEGFLVCYSVIDGRSFEEAKAYKELIERVRNCENIPVVLVGNKCDLENLRKVSTEDGKHLARQWACPFYETSAALRHFVDDSFHGLIREIRRKEYELVAAMEKQNKKIGKGAQFKNFFTSIFKKEKQ